MTGGREPYLLSSACSFVLTRSCAFRFRGGWMKGEGGGDAGWGTRKLVGSRKTLSSFASTRRTRKVIIAHALHAIPRLQFILRATVVPKSGKQQGRQGRQSRGLAQPLFENCQCRRPGCGGPAVPSGEFRIGTRRWSGCAIRPAAPHASVASLDSHFVRWRQPLSEGSWRGPPSPTRCANTARFGSVDHKYR
jgi:hypothetical protein